jgi:hypothetical protein
MRHGFGAGRAGTRILTLAAAMLAGWLATTAAAASEISDPAKIPGLTDTTREAYLRFLKSEPSPSARTACSA